MHQKTSKHDPWIYCRILKNISAGFPYIEMYYVINCIIFSKTFPYIFLSYGITSFSTSPLFNTYLFHCIVEERLQNDERKSCWPQGSARKQRYDQFIDWFLLVILPNNYCTHYWVPNIFPAHGYSSLISNNKFFLTNFTQIATKLTSFSYLWAVEIVERIGPEITGLWWKNLSKLHLWGRKCMLYAFLLWDTRNTSVSQVYKPYCTSKGIRKS